MAGDIRIKYVSGVIPLSDDKRILVCSGKVRGAFDPDSPNEVVCGVGGLLDNGTSEVVGKTVMFCNRGNGKVARWLIVFRLPNDFSGTSTLTIRGFVVDGTPPADRTRDNIPIPRSTGGAAKAVKAEYGVQIADPPAGRRPPSEAEFFVASGLALEGHTAVSAIMNGVNAEYVGTEDGFWCAVFPPLQAEDDGDPIDYILLVENNGGHTASEGYFFSA